MEIKQKQGTVSPKATMALRLTEIVPKYVAQISPHVNLNLPPMAFGPLDTSKRK